MMKSSMTLLVIEDNPDHNKDFVLMMDKECRRLPVSLRVIQATNLKSAWTSFELWGADIVLTDVFFPSVKDGDDQEPNGQKIIEYCLAEQKPVVWVTSTYHHGQKTNELNEWGRKLGLEMFDCPDAGRDGEAPHKPWREALYGLLYLAVAIDEGHYVFENGQLVEPGGGRSSRYVVDPSIIEEFFLGMEVNGNHISHIVQRKMIELGFPRSYD